MNERGRKIAGIETADGTGTEDGTGLETEKGTDLETEKIGIGTGRTGIEIGIGIVVVTGSLERAILKSPRLMMR